MFGPKPVLMTCHRPAYQTLSNAFLKSVKVWNRSLWYCCRCFSMTPRLLKMWSAVLRPDLKSAWSSSSSSSALALSRLRITWSMFLPGWLIRLMVREFWHYLRFPFFGKGMMNDCVHSFGHSFVSQIFWHTAVRTVVMATPPFHSLLWSDYSK